MSTIFSTTEVNVGAGSGPFSENVNPSAACTFTGKVDVQVGDTIYWISGAPTPSWYVRNTSGGWFVSEETWPEVRSAEVSRIRKDGRVQFVGDSNWFDLSSPSRHSRKLMEKYGMRFGVPGRTPFTKDCALAKKVCVRIRETCNVLLEASRKEDVAWEQRRKDEAMKSWRESKKKLKAVQDIVASRSVRENVEAQDPTGG